MNRMPPAVEMDVVVGPKAEGARRAPGAFGPTATSAATAPDPEVPAKAQRRRFTAEYRLRILKRADACKRPGELGALLRREGLYSSHLANWRRQREQGALRDMRGRRRGPTPRPIDPRVKQLEAENRRLQRKLQRAETIIALQKKVAEILGDPPDTPRHRRDRLMRAIEAVTAKGETSALCQSIGVSRASLYRRRRPTPPRPAPRAVAGARWSLPNGEPSATRCTARGLSINRPPKSMRRCLRSRPNLCSPRTMYRVLAEADEVRERRDQVRHPAYVSTRARRGRGAESGLVLGHHQAEGPGPLSLLLAVCDPPTSSAATSWAGWWRSRRAPTWPSA